MISRVGCTLAAMSAHRIPLGQRGRWRVTRWDHDGEATLSGRNAPPGPYTSLIRLTECGRVQSAVMSDDPVELRRHLDFVLRARGRVLVTGLGLGCVVRGLQANPRVDHIDVVERDAEVISLVSDHTPHERAALYLADALEFVEDNDELEWDFAWHDLWTDPEEGEPALPIVHQRLMLALRGRVGWQGAWNYPRYLQRLLRELFPSARAWASA